MITDIRSYSLLQNAFNPYFTVRTDANLIFVNTTPNPILATTLNGDSAGVWFLPFRPAQSPEPWMYIAAREDYKKISTPDPDDSSITAYNVGIQEPQQPPQAAPMQIGFVDFTSTQPNWTNSGTAGAVSDAFETEDTIGDMLPDPVFTSRWSIEVSPDKFYQIGQEVYIGDGAELLVSVQDVIPPISTESTIVIAGIYYFSGNTGRCVIIPSQNAISINAPAGLDTPVADSVLTDPVIPSLRRGALVRLNSSETVLVLSITRGPTGDYCFECETTGTFAVDDTIDGIPTIVVEHQNLSDTFEGQDIVSSVVQTTLSGAGVGAISQALATNPFTTTYDVGDPALNQTVQLDDYLYFTINLSVPSALVAGRLILNVGDTVDYSTEIYYVEFTAQDIIRTQGPAPLPAVAAPDIPTLEEFLAQTEQINTGFGPLDEKIREELIRKYNEIFGNVQSPSLTADTTLYPSSPYVVIQIPIRSLTRAGNNANRTLANCNGVQLHLQTTEGMVVQLGSLWIGGGGQADVGRLGLPYFYVAVPRDPDTGVTGNPSPATRYGLTARRQRIRLQIIDTVLDPQMKVWDWYRYGGTLTSWRYVGTSMNSGGGTDEFTDNLFDTSIANSQTLDRNNFEPWPSIDRPFDATGIATASRVGTLIILTFSDAADVPEGILRWLPGTLILFDDVAFTLWTRPTSLSATVYLLEVAECMGTGVATSFVITEPILARQRLPYVFGPDAAGTMFGCGDPLRPGTVSYSKSYNPDSVPDAYNREIVQPSEPLLGGVIIDGLALVASSARWWALYPQFAQTSVAGAERYQVVERAFGRGLAAPYALCTDGKRLWFVAKDGIYVADSNSAQSLTNDDLRNLFPHEGVNGVDIEYAGLTIYAPDYSRAQSFRLSYCKSYLYFDYEDSTGTRRTLVLDLGRERPCWSVDSYANEISVHYWLEGPESNFESDPLYPDALYPILLMGDTENNVFVQRDLSNDAGVPIDCAFATFEYNGGDKRADQWWGDGMLDCTPHATIFTVQPVSNRVLIGDITTIDNFDVRDQYVIHSSGLEAKYLGYLAQWTDDFDYFYTLTEQTRLYGWQPLYQQVPLRVFTWKTQGTSFGISGYFHLREVLASYRATAEVRLTISVYDGTSPVVVTLPATNDEEQKILFPFSFNKGLLYFFTGESDEPWHPYFDAWEFKVGAWGRTTPYAILGDVEAPKGIGRSIE